MAKPTRTNKSLKLPSSRRSPLRIINFILAFAIAGVLFLAFSRAATVAGYYGSVEIDQANRINNARASTGTAGLQHIECLNALAEQWAKKMADAGGISHNPNIANEVSYACGNSWSIAGENVGVGYDSAGLFNAFMASPGHKANILDSRFTKLGVGAYYTSDGRLWVTQMFAKCTSCGGNWRKNATVATDPVATFSCPKVPNMTPPVSLTNLSQASKPADSGIVQTVTTSSEVRDYYYSSAGSRYTVAFSNHGITSISPNAPVVSGSHTHPNGNSTATGQHQVNLDYTPLFKATPDTTTKYTPKITYNYAWNFTQSLWVKRYAKNADGSRGSLLYAPAESNGDGTGGTVTDQLTKVVSGSTAGTMYGPTLGPCK